MSEGHLEISGVLHQAGIDCNYFKLVELVEKSDFSEIPEDALTDIEKLHKEVVSRAKELIDAGQSIRNILAADPYSGEIPRMIKALRRRLED